MFDMLMARGLSAEIDGIRQMVKALLGQVTATQTVLIEAGIVSADDMRRLGTEAMDGVDRAWEKAKAEKRESAATDPRLDKMLGKESADMARALGLGDVLSGVDRPKEKS